MRWHGGSDRYGRQEHSAFSAVVPGEGELGFEWRVTLRRNRLWWTVSKSAPELLPNDHTGKTFKTSDEAIAWCETEEQAIIAAAGAECVA
jgi:hypothetical protein